MATISFTGSAGPDAGFINTGFSIYSTDPGGSHNTLTTPGGGQVVIDLKQPNIARDERLSVYIWPSPVTTHNSQLAIYLTAPDLNYPIAGFPP